jgi:hypothetical protein
MIDNPLGMTTRRFKESKKPLPRLWYTLDKSICAEASVQVRKRDKVRLKVLVFDSKAALGRFWRERLGIPIGSRCNGVVSSLRNYEGDNICLVDPRYFAIMGLVKTRLSYQIITHEACHAAGMYVDRTLRHKRRFSDNNEPADEELAYPLGIIADSVFNWLNENHATITADTHTYGKPAQV